MCFDIFYSPYIATISCIESFDPDEPAYQDDLPESKTSYRGKMLFCQSNSKLFKQIFLKKLLLAYQVFSGDSKSCSFACLQKDILISKLELICLKE